MNLCRSCQEGEYGDTVGAIKCKKCAPGTVSKAGSTSCQCVGLNRKYIAETGSCICMTGYEPVDSSKADNGLSDCARIIFDHCLEDQLRDSNGRCRNINDCMGTCKGNGTISIDFGICECEYYTTVDSLCNAECQKSQPQIYFNSDGLIQVRYPDSNTTETTSLTNTAGTAKCAKVDPTECTVTKITMVNNDSGDFGANFEVPMALPDVKPSTKNKSNRYTGTREFE